MDHNSVQSQLQAYLDGTLPPEELRAVRAHMDGCADCRAELALLREGRLKQAAEHIDFRFLAALGIGAGAAVVSLAKLITWLINAGIGVDPSGITEYLSIPSAGYHLH